MCEVPHSRWTVVLCVEYSVLQWTLCGRYCTTCRQWYCELNGVCYSQHFVEVISQQVDSRIAAWMECITVNIMWNLLHSRWTVLLWVECSVLQWTFSGRYCTAFRQCNCRLNGVRYIKHYVEDTAQHLDNGIAVWMQCVLVNFMWKILHSRWTVVFHVEWSVLQWTLCLSYCTAGGQ